MDINYEAGADLFPSRFSKSRRHSLSYRRFERAADALKFAVEQLPSEILSGTFLEVDDRRFSGAQIRDLYNSEKFPLNRLNSALLAT